MKTILFQLDTDPLASTFDRVVAVDSGIDEVFSYGGVNPENVEPLIHGGMFTRGPKDLKNTAVFIGGSDVAAGEALLEKVTETFFGPIRLSVMMDSNGSNTTAAAAVLSAREHLELSGIKALVAGGTGPVGMRAVELLARAGAQVNVGSRKLDRAEATCQAIVQKLPEAQVNPCQTGDEADKKAALRDVSLVIAAGAFGVQLLSDDDLQAAESLQVAIDLNAVPPLGIAGVEVTDAAVENDDRRGRIEDENPHRRPQKPVRGQRPPARYRGHLRHRGRPLETGLIGLRLSVSRHPAVDAVRAVRTSRIINRQSAFPLPR